MLRLYRILRPGGIFLTQQVGGENNIHLNELLQDEVYFEYANWTLAECSRGLSEAGFRILQAREDRSLRVYSGDYSGPYSFLFNMSKPPLDDPRVRRALAHAWNQEFVKQSPMGRSYERLAKQLSQALNFMETIGIATDRERSRGRPTDRAWPRRPAAPPASR